MLNTTSINQTCECQLFCKEYSISHNRSFSNDVYYIEQQQFKNVMKNIEI